MSEPRTIKKYPNRRLYDTVESRYITLADIRRLVIERIDFVVIDKKSQEDITRSILLQVIAEQEHGGDPLMSRDFLSQVIRSYGAGVRTAMGSYLEQSLKLFAGPDAGARRPYPSALGSAPGVTHRREHSTVDVAHREADAPLAIHLEHLHADHIPFVELVAHALDALVRDLRYVHQAIAPGKDRDERTKVH